MNYTTPPPYGNYNNPGDWWSTPQGRTFERNDFFAEGPEGKSRGLAAILAIFLGGFGIHYFYMGKTTAGLIFLLVSICSCGAIPALVGFVQGIVMCCMTNIEWRNKYVTAISTLPLF